jgi:glycosyltransferase involved in cell wall biosynthesis
MGEPAPFREALAPESAMPRVGYVTIEDVRTCQGWPRNEIGHMGNAYTLAEVMRTQQFQVEHLGPVPMPGPWARAGAQARLRLFGTRQLLQVQPALLRRQAKDIAGKLTTKRVDLLFGNNSRPFAELDTPLPIIVWRDATFAGALRVHRDFTRVLPGCVALGHRMETAALNKCTIAIFRTRWAAHDAIHRYGVDPAKIRILPTGGNVLHACPRDAISEVIEARSRRRCELLFVGVDWEGKGGDIALATTHRLAQMGVDTRLTILGTHPKSRRSLPANTEVIDYVNIFAENGRAQYQRLVAAAHFLIFPSRVDTYGNVLPEGNAFGVPGLTADIAGLPEVIRSGINGHVFPVGGDDEAGTYADCIAEYMQDFDRYLALAHASYNEYRARLAWDVVGPAFGRIVQDVVRVHGR